MNINEDDDAVARWCALTGGTAEQATFYLDAHARDLDRAVVAFFDDAERSNDMDGDDNDHETHDMSAAAASTHSEPQRTTVQPPAPSTSSSSRLRTLNDIMRAAASEGPGDDDDDHENYFAGGEKSGVMMQGGPKDRNIAGAAELVKEILAKAAKAGPPPERDAKASKPSFSGSGYRLGSENDANASSSSSSSSSRPLVPEPPAEQELVQRGVTFWRNGFSIEDGPLLSYEDPRHQEFLKAINSGRAPTSLLNVQYGQPVEVKVDQRMEEDYKAPPKKPAPAFSGSGQRLGGVENAASASSAMPGAFPGGSSAVSTGASTGSAPAQPVPATINVDNSAPVTSIQIRLPDGTKLVVKMNHTHTVADIRGFITASRPDLASRSFALQTSFPKKDLDNPSETLKDAGLLNAVIQMRLL